MIKRLNLDSPEAMKQIFDLYYLPLCSYALRYVACISIAEEIVSDVMYKVWQNRHFDYHADTFREYLHTATRNTALNYLKQKQNLQNLSDNWAEHIREELIEETPLDRLITKEMQDKLENLMSKLPDQCRKTFLMSRIDDMTYEEIATLMNISVNTVKYHIKTALQKLRNGLREFI